MRRMQKNREARLFSLGLHMSEAKVLKVIPLNVPYFKNFINDRIKLKNRAIKEKWTATKLEGAVRLYYEARVGLQRGQRLDKATILKMLKWYENEWRRTADPNDPYLLKQKRAHHGRYEALNRPKVLQQKAEYRRTHAAEIAEYRRKNHAKILDAERKRRAFKRSQGLGK